jgi:hypothetical protein
MKTLLALAIVIIFAACNGSNPKPELTDKEHDSITSVAAMDTARYTTIQWVDPVRELGELKGDVVEKISFTFKNTGTYPLFIISASPSCGCTVADYPKEAIAPGNEGTITAGFDTKTQHAGEFRKSIIVTTNTIGQNMHTLIFSGKIVKDDEHAAAEKQPVQ